MRSKVNARSGAAPLSSKTEAQNSETISCQSRSFLHICNEGLFCFFSQKIKEAEKKICFVLFLLPDLTQQLLTHRGKRAEK